MLDGIVLEIQSVVSNHLLHFSGMREINIQLHTITRADRIHAIVGLLMEPAGIQRRDAKVGTEQPVHRFDEHDSSA